MMNDDRLCSLLTEAVNTSLIKEKDFLALNRRCLEYYLMEPMGDEEDGRSQVISPDVQDVVESDMPTLARVFLGSGDVAVFEPTSSDPKDIEEAEQKTRFINWVIDHVPNSYRTQLSFLKNVEIQKCAQLHYGIRDFKKTSTKTYRNLDELEIAALIKELEQKAEVKQADITKKAELEGDRFDVDIRCTIEKQQYFIESIPLDSLILSRQASCKDDAEVVGHYFKKRRGQLIEDGFPKELVQKLPRDGQTDEDRLKQLRFRDQGGYEEYEGINDDANDLITGENLYPLIDYDQDGIAERRHVVKVGNHILKNDPFDHVPYVIASAILMPDVLIGRSRAELTLQTQKVNTVLKRGLLDNTYAVNNPQVFVNDDMDVDTDALLSRRLNGIVLVDGNPQEAAQTFEIPYIGDRTLQVLQYMDSERAQSTGTLMSSQGLDADRFYKETATRFEGTQDAGFAKIELVVRNIAETAYKELYEGLAWHANHFQNDELEIMVLGSPLTINPNKWVYEHTCSAVVGTGAGDDEKVLENVSAILALQEKLAINNSPLVDAKKIYNAIDKAVKAAGFHRTDLFFNDPERPQQLIQYENQLLRTQLQEAMAALENPLEGAEKIKQQGTLMKAQMEQQHDLKMKMLDIAQDDKELQARIMEKFTELELKYGTDLPQGVAL